MCKSLCFLSPLLCVICLAEEPDDTPLLNEFLMEQLKQYGIETNWSFSGELNGAAIAIHQKLGEKDGAPDEGCFATLDGDVYLRYFKRDTSFGYGLEIGNKVKSGILKQGSAIVDTSYIFVEADNIGKIKIGYTNTAADSFTVSYANILTGYTGPDSGNLATFYGQTSGSIICTGFDRDDNKACKVVWLSPVISGWSCGLSYTPNSRDGHLFKINKNKVEKDYSPKQNFADQTSYSIDAITGGIAYEYGDPEEFNAKIAVAGWYARGRADYTRVRNVKGYNVGAVFGYKDYKLALGYTDNGRSMLPVEVSDESDKTGFCHGADAGKVYNVAIAYTYNKLDVSFGYFHAVRKFSSHERSNSNIATLAAQYNFDRFFSVYAEYDNIRTKTCQRAIDTELESDGHAFGNNHANMFVIGTKVRI